jgi:hypothetical protein
MSDETTKYQKEWDAFKDQQANGCLTGVIFVISFIIVSTITTNYPQYAKISSGVLIGIFLVLFVNYFYKQLAGKNWKCPRCKSEYDDRYLRRRKYIECLNCRLPLYYGSSYFYDQWGTEQGKILAKQITEGKL